MEPPSNRENAMRRIALLSGLVLVGGLLGPSTAAASQDDRHGNDQVRWIAVQDKFTAVLPDGRTLTEDPGQGVPPVGTRVFLSEKLFATDDGKTKGDEVGRDHIECAVQVVQTTFFCDVAFVLDKGSPLLGSAALDFGSQSGSTEFLVAVTGGTTDFFGAGGEVSATDISTSPDQPTVTLYEVDVDVDVAGDGGHSGS
jgi:hypothetical protein